MCEHQFRCNFVTMKSAGRKIELLAPARDADVAIEAIRHGADAVYMGANQFGARAQAGNDVSDIRRVWDYAHQFDARVYATVNTIVYDHELRQVERLVHDLCRAGVDALIVQDMALLRLDLPPIALHASTQCDLRTPEKARFLEALGFSQLVMARELSLGEIAAIRQAVKVPLEAFVHGALCVCYSGRCQASQAIMGRSANRGECAQVCRLPFDLEDEQGRKLMSGKHLLSLRDMNQSGHLEQMLDAGVSSFKIEGRLKDVGYVKNVVAYYRRAIDAILDAHPDRYSRASVGQSTYTFEPCLERSFNRSFTSYFIEGHPAPTTLKMASIDTPKSQGEYLGKVQSVNGRVLRIESDRVVANGDGLSFIGASGAFTGMRVNEVHGRDVVLNQPVSIARGTKIYRTFDKMMNDVLSRPSAQRRIALDATLDIVGDQLRLSLADERGNRVTHAVNATALELARTSQEGRQRTELGKLGDTIYTLREARVEGDRFIPASLLAQLRREAIKWLDRAQQVSYATDRRRPEQKDAPCFAAKLVSADNVANHLAEKLYREHGVTAIEPALEVMPSETPLKGREVMVTRYCIRRELGACRRDPKAIAMPAHLYLRYGSTLLQVDCDCAACQMHISLA